MGRRHTWYHEWLWCNFLNSSCLRSRLILDSQQHMKGYTSIIPLYITTPIYTIVPLRDLQSDPTNKNTSRCTCRFDNLSKSIQPVFRLRWAFLGISFQIGFFMNICFLISRSKSHPTNLAFAHPEGHGFYVPIICTFVTRDSQPDVN